MKFGLFEYNTENIGDEVQSIAARRFLPQIDYYFDRDNIDATKTDGEPVKIIMNGWYTHKPENWPPKNPDIVPLLVSMYIEQYANHGKLAKAFINKKGKEYFAAHGPVGARDKATLAFLKQHNIKAYFSGCVTLTLLRDKNIKKQDYVLAVDVKDEVYEKMKQETKRPILRIDTNRCIQMDRAAKFALAEYYLYRYQSAHAVVTSRLHCMLPCLALETPVLAISGREPHRYAGLIDLVNHTTEEDYLSGKYKYSLDNPKANPERYKTIREKLIKQCSEFTGCDTKNSFFSYGTVDNLLHSIELRTAFSTMTTASFKLEHYMWHYNGLSQYVKDLEQQNKDLAEENKRLEIEVDKYKNAGIRRAVRILARSVKRKVKKN